MTVYKVETVKNLIAEIGEQKISSIYKYKHAHTGVRLYAVFLTNQFIDIFRSPFCTDIETIFYNGKWEKELE